MAAAPRADLQIPEKALTLPQVNELWSSWYKEGNDTFEDFETFNPPTPTTGGGSAAASFHTLSARQMSGQMEEEVAKSWEEDWEDEDANDTFENIMAKIKGRK